MIIFFVLCAFGALFVAGAIGLLVIIANATAQCPGMITLKNVIDRNQ